MGPSTAFPGSNAVIYVAGAGEANSVTMTAVFNPSYALEIVDAGATITVGSGCTSVTPNTARCSLQFTGAATPRAIEVELGDGNDSLSSLDVELGSALHGGSGDDRIAGGRAEEGEKEYLFGGPGNDLLRGREGDDVLNGGPGADILSGGSSGTCGTAGLCWEHTDTVTYAGRTNDVFADDDGIADDGEALEGDMIRRNVERLVGGRGNDVLAGTTHVASVSDETGVSRVGTGLRGRGGNDRLLGTRASDGLSGGKGNDVVRGGRAADSIEGNGGNDRLIGGRGHDQIRGGTGQDRLLARDGRADRVNGGRGPDEARIDSALDRVQRVETILP